MTESEEIFEHFCRERNLCFQRIPEGKTKSPDYYLQIGNVTTVVEIKQIDANTEERQILEKSPEEWSEYEIYHWGIPGERIRNKITSATRQLKILSKGRYRTLLIVYDNIKMWPELVDEYSIRVAMYGVETALISSEAAPEGGAKILNRWYGMRKKTTAQHNTTLSAIAVMSEEEGNVSMSIYHNWYANIPLDMDLFTLQGVKQFEMEQCPDICFTGWKKASKK